VELLSRSALKEVFTEPVLKSFNLNFPIYKAYRYADKTGEYYCALTESMDTITNEDTFSYKIKAINFKYVDGKLSKTWEINDNILKETEVELDETSIWFWTKFSDFKDYDGDGVADPIIIYGTGDMGNTQAGRIKILVYYKGKKYAIRHQNSSLDYGRETTVEKAYYDLPKSIRLIVKQKMKAMHDADVAIFTDDGIMNEPK
jgi:hypothetical protein